MKKIDLSGNKFGKLTVIEEIGKRNNSPLWKCKCECGNYTETTTGRLRGGNTKSCGCYSKELFIKRSKTHGKTHTKLYYVYRTMLSRCYNEKTEKYKNYGARNIKVCDEWKKDFEKFYKWAESNGYEEGLTIERVNVNGNYEPNNCMWATMERQQNNRSNNVRVTWNNETHTIAEWSRITGESYTALYRKNKRGVAFL